MPDLPPQTHTHMHAHPYGLAADNTRKNRHPHTPNKSVMTPGSPERIRQDTAGVIKLYWASARLGRNHTGKQGLHTRPGLVFRAALGAQSRAPWARGLAGLLTAEVILEGKDSLGGFSAGGIMCSGGGNLLKNSGKLDL